MTRISSLLGKEESERNKEKGKREREKGKGKREKGKGKREKEGERGKGGKGERGKGGKGERGKGGTFRLKSFLVQQSLPNTFSSSLPVINKEIKK